jgi:hypothetical protein
LPPDSSQGAFCPVVDGWFYGLEEEVLAEGGADPADAATESLLEKRLSTISRSTPQFALALRGYRRALAGGDAATADGLIAWLGGQPHVGASAKRAAGVKGDVDHFAALSFLRGLLTVLRDSGYAGLVLVLVLDEVETLQRVSGDVREKGLNALRQLVDEVDAGRFPHELATRLDEKVTSDNFAVRFSPDPGAEAIGPALDGLREVDPGSLVAPASDQAIDGLKFSECLPRDLAARVVQSRLADARGVTGALGQVTRTVVTG